MLPNVSVILPVYNEEQYLEICLKTLKQVDYPKDKLQIITVDNGSTDRSLEIAQQYADSALFLPDVNVGAVRNFGVENSLGEVLAFLDSDCLVPRNWLRTGTSLLKSNPKHVYGGNLHLRENPFWIERYWLLESNDSNTAQHELLGSCIMIPRNFFLEAGMFDEILTSGEDSALSLKLKSMGLQVLIDPDLGVVHLGNPTTISDFVKRQIWHSENYMSSLKTSIKDKVFWLVTLYILSWLGIFFSPIYPLYSPIFVIAMLGIPAVFSAKRIMRSKSRNTCLLGLMSVYVIDHFYLIGRSLGLIKGMPRTHF